MEGADIVFVDRWVTLEVVGEWSSGDDLGPAGVPVVHDHQRAGVVFASIVTFGLFGELLIAGTSVLNDLGVVDIWYWMPTAIAAVLTVIPFRVSIKREMIKYEPG